MDAEVDSCRAHVAAEPAAGWWHLDFADKATLRHKFNVKKVLIYRFKHTSEA